MSLTLKITPEQVNQLVDWGKVYQRHFIDMADAASHEAEEHAFMQEAEDQRDLLLTLSRFIENG